MSGRLCWTEGGAAVKTKGLLTALAFVSLALTACVPGVQPLLDEYNALFDSVTERGKEQVAAGKLDWLQDTYDVPVSNTLNLHAPEHCTSYEWRLEPYPGIVPEVPLPQGFDIETFIDKDSRSWLKLDLRKAGFKSGTYLLTSTVERGGRTLTDTSKITVQEAAVAGGGDS